MFLIVASCGLFVAGAALQARKDGLRFVRLLPGPETSETASDGASGWEAPTRTRPEEILLARPADAAAFRDLADAAAARGDSARAQRLYAIAARRDPRDAQAQLRLADAALARHDAASALRHLDAAMRVAPDVAEPTLRRILQSLGDPAIRAALAARLADDPPWRDRFASLLEAADPRAAQALLATLSARPLPPAELALRMSLLESLGSVQAARAAWHDALPATVRALDGRVFDGGFESAGGPPPYGWRLTSSPEALVGLETAHVAQGHGALAVLVQGRAVLLADVSQRLVLAPAAYALSLQADSSLTGSGRGFAWVVACNAPERELVRLALPRQTAGWQRFTIDFQVPPGCDTQTLRLVHEGRNLAERSVAGRLGVDSMQILPVPGR